MTRDPPNERGAGGARVGSPSNERGAGGARVGSPSNERGAGGARVGSRGLPRAPLLLLGMLALLAGLAGGLARIGWGVAPLPPGAVPLHGPLMVAGFLGTLIGLERAVAFGRRWGYAAPLCTGLGALAVAAGAPPRWGAALVALGAALLLGVSARAAHARPARWSVTQALAAGCFLVGCLRWAAGAAIPAALPWWEAFLVLTIVGERLELSRLRRPGAAALRLYAALVGLVLAGAGASSVAPELGARLYGAGWLGLALWLARWDLATRSLRRPGLARFMGGAVLSGLLWLGASGGLALALGAPTAGPAYDAIVHALFLGLAFAMIFGHAPVIFPGILRSRIRFRRSFWAHLALLHAGVVLRVAADLASWQAGRAWGGALNVLAILLFLAQTARSLERRAGSAPV